jgi:hypothetical protein
MFYHTGILLHIIGIMLIGGGSIGSLFVENAFWKKAKQSPNEALLLAPLMQQLPIVIIVGSVLMLASGLLLLYVANWAYIYQPWLLIKLVLYIILMLNGALVAKPLGAQIARMVATYPAHSQLHSLQKKMTRFHLVQFTLLLAVFVLAVFKIK